MCPTLVFHFHYSLALFVGTGGIGHKKVYQKTPSEDLSSAPPHKTVQWWQANSIFSERRGKEKKLNMAANSEGKHLPKNSSGSLVEGA